MAEQSPCKSISFSLEKNLQFLHDISLNSITFCTAKISRTIYTTKKGEFQKNVINRRFIKSIKPARIIYSRG